SPASSAFFLHCSRVLRELHSFPTRRSSDLTGVVVFEDVTPTPPPSTMPTPYDGRVAIWHWKGDVVPETTIEDLAANLKRNAPYRSEEHTSELQSRENLVCRLLLEKKKNTAH